MKILFVSSYPYLPQTLGGMQNTTDQLCRQLMKRGHKTAVLAGFKPTGALALVCRMQKKILRREASRDNLLGYSVWRAWFPWEVIEYVAARECPDVIVSMSGQFVRTALAARRTNRPVILQMHDVYFDRHGGDIAELRDIPSIAVSQFVTEKYHAAFGFNPKVIYPFIPTEKYKTITTRENVTFINPTSGKGFDVAFRLASLFPQIPFSFVETWSTASQRQDLAEKTAALPNIILSPPQKDMRKIYSKCKILLAPSKWEEAYGMVATEAQISGIPVVASSRGGLPEAVGPGGILLDPEGPIDEWATAIGKLWQDEDYYSRLSAAALHHAQRPEMDHTIQADAWEKALLSAFNSEQKKTSLNSI